MGPMKMRPNSLSLLFYLVVATSLAGCLTGNHEADSVDSLLEFEQHSIVTAPTKHQTVLMGKLLGGAMADLIVVQLGPDERGRLHVYANEVGAWQLRINTEIRSEVLFVDVASCGGTDRLITYEPGRLNWFDCQSGVERKLQSVAFNFRQRQGDGIPQVDVTKDLDGDGRDEILLPGFDELRVLRQFGDGSFSAPEAFGPPEPFRDESPLDSPKNYKAMGINSKTIPWLLSRVYQMDYDQDGRDDLVFWGGDQFQGYREKLPGVFASVAEVFPSNVPFDSDGAYSLMFEYGDATNLSLVLGLHKSSERTVLQSVHDMNGDGIVDLLTHSLKGRSVLKQQSQYELHLGRGRPEGIMFETKASTTIEPLKKGGALQPWGYSTYSLHDFDGDGQTDILLTHIRIGIGGMARALIGNSVSLDLEVYQMANGSYPSKPSFRRQIKPSFRPLSKRNTMFFPVAFVGDISGDGLLDLLVGKSRQELHVWMGVSGPELFQEAPQKVKIDLPADHSRDIRLVDINGDQKQDLLLHHRSENKANRVTMLIAK